VCVEKFRFDFDFDRGLLTIAMSGFWDFTTLEQFAVALPAALRALTAARRHTALLVDMRDFPVQARELVAQQERILFDVSPLFPERGALVVSSALFQLQAERVAGNFGHRVFRSMGPALDWLLEEYAEAA
jgi:hypothetical protein